MFKKIATLLCLIVLCLGLATIAEADTNGTCGSELIAILTKAVTLYSGCIMMAGDDNDAAQ